MTGDTHKLAETATRSDKLLRGKSPTFAIGAVLIALGVLLFAGQLLGFSLGGLLWPLWIIVPRCRCVALWPNRLGRLG